MALPFRLPNLPSASILSGRGADQAANIALRSLWSGMGPVAQPVFKTGAVV
jgi:hypothetical protein